MMLVPEVAPERTEIQRSDVCTSSFPEVPTTPISIQSPNRLRHNSTGSAQSLDSPKQSPTVASRSVSVNFNPISLNSKVQVVAVEKVVEKTELEKVIEKDKELSKYYDFNDTYLIKQVQNKLQIDPESSAMTIENLRKFATGFYEWLNHDLLRYCDSPAHESHIFGADDTVPMIMRCLVRAASHSHTRDMLSAFTAFPLDSCLESVDLRDEEFTMISVLQGISKLAMQWLVNHNFLDKDIKWPVSDYTIKLAIIGPLGVGKTSLLLRYTQQRFVASQSTVGVDTLKTVIVLPNDIKVTCVFWDTAGQERFGSLSQAYLRDIDGILMVYDASACDSVDKVYAATTQYYKAMKLQHAHEVPYVIFGNKVDLIPEDKEVVHINDPLQKSYVGSALTGENVQFAFLDLIYDSAMFKHNFRTFQREMSTSAEVTLDSRNVGEGSRNDSVNRKSRCCS